MTFSSIPPSSGDHRVCRAQSMQLSNLKPLGETVDRLARILLDWQPVGRTSLAFGQTLARRCRRAVCPTTRMTFAPSGWLQSKQFSQLSVLRRSNELRVSNLAFRFRLFCRLLTDDFRLSEILKRVNPEVIYWDRRLRQIARHYPGNGIVLLKLPAVINSRLIDIRISQLIANQTFVRSIYAVESARLS